MYGHLDTKFIAWAKKNGARQTVDGIGMLFAQAAESFYLWHGIMPNIEDALKIYLLSQKSVVMNDIKK
jgi:shikimate dehydrogenase